MLFGEPLNGANRLPVVAVVVDARKAATRIEVEKPRVVVVRARNGRPVEAVRTGIAERSTVAATGGRKKDAIRSILSPASNNISIHAILRCPRPVAIAVERIQFLLCWHAPIVTPMNSGGVMR